MNVEFHACSTATTCRPIDPMKRPPMTTATDRKEAAARLRAAAEWLDNPERAEALGIDVDFVARTLVEAALTWLHEPRKAA